jgi:hypothetical protein
MTELTKYDCHCHMDKDGNSPVFYLASEVDALLAQLRAALERRYPHWRCDTHGDFDARVAVGCPGVRADDARSDQATYRRSRPVRRRHSEAAGELAGGRAMNEGRRLGGDPADEREHFEACAECGQEFDKRDLSQVRHHNVPGHPWHES